MAEQNAGAKAMAELYREEVTTHGSMLTRDVLRLEALGAEDTPPPDVLQPVYASLLRAAHSLKGAARVMRLERVATVAHELEETLVAGQSAAAVPDQQGMDTLLDAVDFLNASVDWVSGVVDTAAITLRAERCIAALRRQTARFARGYLAAEQDEGTLDKLPAHSAGKAGEPMLRIRTELVNELLQLGAQGRVLSHRMDQLPQHFSRLSEQHLLVEQALEGCSAQLAVQGLDAAFRKQLLAPLREQMEGLRHLRSRLWEQVSICVQEQALLSERWYAQVLACRTRPFSDIVSGFPRLVRDMGRALGKQIVLHIEGAATLADRDIMESLEMPLVHLLRNACSHGIEPVAVRLAAGKPRQGNITLGATHSDGWLQVSLRDDGRGIDLDLVRSRLLANGVSVEGVSGQELLEQIFTQGFSTSERADAVSGRGVGLAAVRERIRDLGGYIGVESHPGTGVIFTLHVPVSRALLRVLCVRLDGEPYALPLGQIESLVRVDEHERTEEYVMVSGQPVPIISLRTLLGIESEAHAGTAADAVGSVVAAAGSSSMVVLRHRGRRYVLDAGAVEDELELIVHELDERLGAQPLLQAAGLNESGEVVLVLDVEALCARAVSQVRGDGLVQPVLRDKRLHVLLAEDAVLARARIGSILTEAGGFELTIAEDGQAAWERLRAEPMAFDLLLSDLEMPRMDGCELARMVRESGAGFATLPIVIISACDGDFPRRCGEHSGANLYLSKSLLGSDPQAFVRALRETAEAGAHR